MAIAVVARYGSLRIVLIFCLSLRLVLSWSALGTVLRTLPPLGIPNSPPASLRDTGNLTRGLAK
ncbi:MAG: hypothetical protein JZU63_14090, partial [Rhodoferax sp.]|nr:hypothetical protein [Rhodoferax sp.]